MLSHTPSWHRWLWSAGGLAIVLVLLFPIYWMFAASLQPGASSVNVQIVPPDPSLSGYADALSTLAGAIRTSLVVALGAVALSLVVAVPAGFALSRLRGRIVDVSLFVILIAQMVPTITLMNALYAMFNTLGILNTYTALILANGTSAIPFAVIVLRSFLLSLDSEVLEAAMLDGAGTLQRLVRIVVPLGRNAIITAGVFAFIFTWGDLLIGLTLTTESQIMPAVLAIYRLMDAPQVDWATVMSAAFLTAMPAIVLLGLSQRYIKAGIGAGAGR